MHMYALSSSSSRLYISFVNMLHDDNSVIIGCDIDTFALVIFPFADCLSKLYVYSNSNNLFAGAAGDDIYWGCAEFFFWGGGGGGLNKLKPNSVTSDVAETVLRVNQSH